MNRVLSFPQSHSCDDPSEAVSKRFCFSCIFSISFISLIIGYLLGSRPSNVNITFKTEPNYMETLRTTPLGVRSQVENKSSERYTDQVFKLQEHFKANNFDVISPVVTAKVILTFKNKLIADTIEILTDNGTPLVHDRIVQTTTNIYHIPDPVDEINPFDSNFEGPPVYGNFGTEEDLNYLTEKGILLYDHVILLRLGRNSIIEKVSNVLKRGIKGILLFADPQQYPRANCIPDQNEIHPVLLTQLLQLRAAAKCFSNCRVAIQVIDATTVQKIFKEMASTNKSPDSWHGFLTTSYFIGPGFQHKNWKILLNCHFVEVRYTTRDITAYLRGVEEPDRYVVISSNRANLLKSEQMDDSTDTLIEMTQVLANLKNKMKWTPTRTLVFISFALGDIELSADSWIQRHVDVIKQRTVAYIQIKQPGRGLLFNAESSPIMDNLLSDLSTSILKSDRGSNFGRANSPLELWGRRLEPLLKRNFDKTSCDDLQDWDVGAAAEIFSSFGIPALTFSYTNKEDHFMIENISNEEYKNGIIRLWAMLAFSLASKTILPFNFTVYLPMLESYNHRISGHKQLLQNLSIIEDFEDLNHSTRRVTSILPNFQHDVHSTSDKNKNRMINDKLIQIHRLFLCILDTYEFLMKIIADLFISPENEKINSVLKKGKYCITQIEYLIQNV